MFRRKKGQGSTSPNPLRYESDTFLFDADFFPSSSPLSFQDKQSLRPLSTIPIPTLTTVGELSTPTLPVKRTRGGTKRTGRGSAATSVEPTASGEDDNLPAKKNHRAGSEAV